MDIERKIMELKHVYKVFKKNGCNINVLNDINYIFQENKMYGIQGQSGSGKTTLINILGLLSKTTSGMYILNDTAISKLSNSEICRLRNENIGFVFQNLELNDYLTAIENVELPMLINKKINSGERVRIAKYLLEKVGLKDRIQHYPNELSGGEQQRVAIARALANNPKVLLCDEPTSSLDKANTKKVFDLLKKISKEGFCVIVVSHDDSLFEYADICLELKNGNLFEVTK